MILFSKNICWGNLCCLAKTKVMETCTWHVWSKHWSHLQVHALEMGSSWYWANKTFNFCWIFGLAHEMGFIRHGTVFWVTGFQCFKIVMLLFGILSRNYLHTRGSGCHSIWWLPAFDFLFFPLNFHRSIFGGGKEHLMVWFALYVNTAKQGPHLTGL